MQSDKTVVGFDGVCPICGSIDGMIVFGKDGKYRTMCRMMNCPARYKPSPRIVFGTVKECENPFESEYLKDGNVTVEEYILGEKVDER
jgi:hypothetical protein